MSEARSIIWSNGGGTQSAAIAVLIAQGKLPKPDHVLMADTGRECQTTWDYLDRHIRPLLAQISLEVEVIPHSYSIADLYNKEGTMLLPAFTQSGNKVGGFCSGYWKRDVVIKRLREMGYGVKKPVVQWIGMSRDEIHRCKGAKVKWIENQWPLIMGYGITLTRAMCMWVVENAGLPTPPKSRCWMCPHQNDSEWIELKLNRPDEFEQAVTLEDRIRKADSKGGLFLHRSAIPLSSVKFQSNKTELPLFQQTDCESGLCWV